MATGNRHGHPRRQAPAVDGRRARRARRGRAPTVGDQGAGHERAVELYRVVPGSQARRQGCRVIDSDYSNRVVTVQYVTKPAIRTGGLPLRDEDSNMVAHTVSLTVVILALSGYVVWADRRARRDRSHLAQELGQIREAIRGHEQAQEIVMAAAASQ